MNDSCNLKSHIHPTMRVVFFGTPQFAVPTLEALAGDPHIEIVGIVTQPDRPSGRGQKLTPPPVKHIAEVLHLGPIFQPLKVRTDEAFLNQLDALKADFFVTIAFGQILPQRLLDMPRLGTVNVHASLLPKLRGANPIQWAILNGLSETGLTTMLTDAGVDTGAMLLKTTVSIDPSENAQMLAERLATLGGPLLLQTLSGLENGSLKPLPQEDTLASHAPKLSKQEAWLDWSQPAEVLLRKIRGQQPWPGTQSLFDNQPLKIFEAHLLPSDQPYEAAMAGELLEASKFGVMIACGATGKERLMLTTVQPAGKKPMPASDWLRGLGQPLQASRRCLSAPDLAET
ncbi:MAG: methionyl-tRNA formyltransferase [Vampirovibrionales bacterium]|nr:methionyl-tRNA formyltransferase [Vampirovibrionales bacterium]